MKPGIKWLPKRHKKDKKNPSRTNAHEHVIQEEAERWGQGIYAAVTEKWGWADGDMDMSSVSTSGTWRGNNTLRDHPPAAARLTICHVGQECTQACRSTCRRDRLLVYACDDRSPRNRVCPENRPETSGPHQLHKSRPNPFNLIPSFIPSSFSIIRWVHIISSSPSLGFSHFTSWKVVFFSALFFFFLQFCLPLSLFATLASWDLFKGTIQILCTHQGRCQSPSTTQLHDIWDVYRFLFCL